jgi:hypothetical protein
MFSATTLWGILFECRYRIGWLLIKLHRAQVNDTKFIPAPPNDHRSQSLFNQFGSAHFLSSEVHSDEVKPQPNVRDALTGG